MSTVDYINTLGGGAGFDTKEVVSAMVEAQRAPVKARLDQNIHILFD